jgi:hypothetical protein
MVALLQSFSGETDRIAIKIAQIAPTCLRSKTHQNSKPFAGIGVTNRGHEEAEPEGQQENIQHGILLSAVYKCGVLHGAKETPLDWVQK